MQKRGIMNYNERIRKIINKQQGTLLTQDLDQNEIPRTYLSIMVAEGKLERVERGAYVLPDLIEDEMFILQNKYPTLVYSHETALYIHGLSDRNPFEYSATVQSGYKATKALSAKSKIYYVKKNLHQMGVIEGKTYLGNTIKVYNLERTICDLLRSRNRIDIQIFSDALKRLATKRDLDYILLNEYAKKFSVEKILNTYMKVLI